MAEDAFRRRTLHRRDRLVQKLLQEPDTHLVNMAVSVEFAVPEVPREILEEAVKQVEQAIKQQQQRVLDGKATPLSKRGSKRSLLPTGSKIRTPSRGGPRLSRAASRADVAPRLGDQLRPTSRQTSRHRPSSARGRLSTRKSRIQLDETDLQPVSLEQIKAQKIAASVTSSYIHYEFRTPQDKKLNKTDIAVHHNGARVFLDSETRSAHFDRASEVLWAGWTHRYPLAVNMDLLKQLYYDGLVIRIWDSKDKVASRARFDRPRQAPTAAGMVPSPSNVGVSRPVTSGQSRPRSGAAETNSVNVSGIRVHIDDDGEEEEVCSQDAQEQPEEDIRKCTLAGVDQSILFEHHDRLRSGIQEMEASASKLSRLEKPTSSVKSLQSSGIRPPSQAADATGNGALLRLDLQPLFRGETTCSATLTQIQETGLSRVMMARITVALDKPLMSKQQEAELNPLVVTFHSVEGLPNSPVSFANLDKHCLPLSLAVKAYKEPEYEIAAHEGQRHVENVKLDSTYVLLTGLYEPQYLRHHIMLAQGFVVEVHDRDVKPSPPDELAEAQAMFGTVADEDLHKPDPAFSRAEDAVVSSQGHRTTPKELDKCNPFGVAVLDLGPLLQGLRMFSSTVPVLPPQEPVNNPSIYPGHYVASGTALNVSVRICHALNPDGTATEHSGAPGQTERQAPPAAAPSPKAGRRSRASSIASSSSPLNPGYNRGRRASRGSMVGDVNAKDGGLDLSPSRRRRRSSQFSPKGSRDSSPGASSRRGSVVATPVRRDSSARASSSLTESKKLDKVDEPRPFTRVVVVLDHMPGTSQVEMISFIRTWVSFHNLQVLGIRSDASQGDGSNSDDEEEDWSQLADSVALTKAQHDDPALDVITGFVVVPYRDAAVLVLEGIADTPASDPSTLSRLWRAIEDRGLSISPGTAPCVRVLANSKLTTESRMYGAVGLALREIQLKSSLAQCLENPGLYLKSNPLHGCLSALTCIQGMQEAHRLSELFRNRLFPSVDSLRRLQRAFGNMKDSNGIANSAGHGTIAVSHDLQETCSNESQGAASHLAASPASRVPLETRNPKFETTTRSIHQPSARYDSSVTNAPTKYDVVRNFVAENRSAISAKSADNRKRRQQELEQRLHDLGIADDVARFEAWQPGQSSGRPIRPEMFPLDHDSESKHSHGYSAQRLNSTEQSVRELQALLARRQRTSDGRRRTFGYSDTYFGSSAMSLRRQEDVDAEKSLRPSSTSAWKTPAGFDTVRNRSVKTAPAYEPSALAREPFEESLAEMTQWKATRGPLPWSERNREVRFGRPEAVRPAISSILLPGSRAEAERKEWEERRRKDWESKLVVSDTRFRGYQPPSRPTAADKAADPFAGRSQLSKGTERMIGTRGSRRS